MSGFRRFGDLYRALDETTSTNEKRDALAAYATDASDADLAWAVFVLTGRRMRRPVSGNVMRDWASQHTGLPAWLIEASYHAVGDLSETLAILCSRGQGNAPPDLSLAEFMEQEVLPLGAAEPDEQRQVLQRWWDTLDERDCFLAHKLVGGALRVGVSATLAVRGFAKGLGYAPSVVEHRLMGTWEPTAAFGARLRAADDGAADRSRPYPFYLASPLGDSPESSGERDEWLAEWKWDGIRAQLIVRGGEVFLWSRGEERLTERFPDLVVPAGHLPDGTVLDGEIVIKRDGVVQPFAVLQTRIGRTNLSAKVLRDSPAVFLAFDLIEWGGEDWRERSLRERREVLAQLLGASGTGPLQLSQAVVAPDWAALAGLRAQSRSLGVEGIMLKRWSSPYRSGRPRGDWWKWKIEPFTMDAVLVYAQAGSGKRASLYTDYTFAVWDGDTLVPVAKAYSGLDDEEIARLDRWIRAHTKERFGPVRVVEPVHVFELGFEAIQRSSRHKAGIAVRFPRILRWRTDKPAREADTLPALHRLLEQAAAAHPAQPAQAEPEAPSLFDDLGDDA